MIPSENNIRDFKNDNYGDKMQNSLNKTYDYSSRYQQSQVFS